MSTRVTAIRFGGPRGRRATLFVDDEPVLTTSREVLDVSGVCVGTEVEPDALHDRLAEVEPACARDRALRLLDFRDRTVHEMRGRLVDEGYREDVVEELLAELVRVGLIDDLRVARNIVRAGASGKLWGDRRIRADLKRRGVPPDLIDTAFHDEEILEESERVLAAAERLVRTDDDAQRLAQRLVRYGYPWEEAGSASRHALRHRPPTSPDGCS